MTDEPPDPVTKAIAEICGALIRRPMALPETRYSPPPCRVCLLDMTIMRFNSEWEARRMQEEIQRKVAEVVRPILEALALKPEKATEQGTDD